MKEETIEQKRKALIKRKKIYFFMGWPLIALGMGLFFYKPAFVLSIIFIVCGVIVRVLYYYINIEIRSLERYEKLLNKTKIILIGGLFILFGINSVNAQLDEGDDAAELKDLKWIVGEPVKILDEENKKIFLIEFCSSKDKASVLSFSLLEKLSNDYGEEQVAIIAVTKEKEEDIKKYLGSVNKKKGFSIAIDPDGKVTKKYIGDAGGLPRAFVIDKDKEVVWSGNPLTIPSVIKKVLKGNFDPDIQKEINKLQIKLQAEMQMQKIPEAIKTADSIIELDSSDELALRVRLFIFERSGNLDGAVKYIDDLLDDSPDNEQLYFIKLDLIERVGGSIESRKRICEEILERFQDDHEILERLAWTAVSRMRFGTAPLSIALQASEKAVSMLIESDKQNPAKLANYLETQARLYYSIGKISKAIEEQEKVIRLRKGETSEEEAVVLFEYYKEALRLNQEKK